MGVWDEFCLICAGPLRNKIDQAFKPYSIKDKVIDNHDYDKYKPIIKKLDSACKWLDSLYIISSTEDKLQTIGKNYTETGSFVVNNDVYIVTPLNWHMEKQMVRIKNKFKDVDTNYGVVCHQDCYNFLKKNLNYKLQFSDVSRLLAVNTCHLKKVKLYKPADKYIDQDYDYVNAVKTDVWILFSPLKDKQNASRILRIWKPLIIKFKKNLPRPSPSESATLFKTGTIVVGYDGQEYIVTQNNGIKRWILNK